MIYVPKSITKTLVIFSIKDIIIYNLRMAQLLRSNVPKGLNIFDLPELLEQILYFLEIDRSLYPALFVNHLWYHCGVPILWRRIKFSKKRLSERPAWSKDASSSYSAIDKL